MYRLHKRKSIQSLIMATSAAATVATTTRRPRSCSNPFCRATGHSITMCDHPSIIEARSSLAEISDYAIGYNCPDILTRCLLRQNKDHLAMLGVPVGTLNKDALRAKIFAKHYTDIISAPGSVEEIRRLACDRLHPDQVAYISSYARSNCCPFHLSPYQTVVLGLPLLHFQRHYFGITEPVPAPAPVYIPNIYALDLALALDRRRNDPSTVRLVELILAEGLESLAVAVMVPVVERQVSRQAPRQTPIHAPRQIGRRVFMVTPKFVELTPEMGVKSEECPICYDPITRSSAKTNCGHTYCSPCMTTYFNSISAGRAEPVCAMCRTNICNLEFHVADELAQFRTLHL